MGWRNFNSSHRELFPFVSDNSFPAVIIQVQPERPGLLTPVLRFQGGRGPRGGRTL